MFFERGQKSQIRLFFFFKDNIPRGSSHYTLTLSASDDVAVTPTLSEEFGLQSADAWPIDTLDWKSSPVDLSFLNESEKPAGRRGYVKASNGRLVFEDGTPAPLLGDKPRCLHAVRDKPREREVSGSQTCTAEVSISFASITMICRG